MKKIGLVKKILNTELLKEIFDELGLDGKCVGEMYSAYQESNSLFEGYFVIEEPFERVLMLKVAREFFKYNQSIGLWK